jgi:S-formylglutathione hydrolase FrmB
VRVGMIAGHRSDRQMGGPMRRARALLAVLVAVLFAVLVATSFTGSALSSASPASPASPAAPPPTTAPTPATADGTPPESQNAGDIVDRPLTDVDPAVADDASSSLLVTYQSPYAISDSMRQVTASIYVPKGAAPADGFPIVALGRPVTGTGAGCTAAATAVADPSPTVEALLQAGYLVVVPDYLGLSQPSGNKTSFHPFLDSTTAANNTIDAVRATRKIVPQASTSWVAMGVGQGGQAAWAVNELADSYGWGLILRGTASISPTADIEGLADAAATGTLTTEQELAYVAYLDALSKEYTNDFHLDQYRRGIVSQNWDLLLGCGTDQAAERASITAQIMPDDLRPASPDALATLQGYIRKTNLPQGPAQTPMLVVFGTQDPLVPAAWTERAIGRACGMGDVISIQKQPEGNAAGSDSATALGWIADRFAGTSAPNDCPSVSIPPPPPMSAPAATLSAPPPALPAQSAVQARDPGTSLISGWLPITVQALAFAVLIAAIGWRSPRWRLRWLPAAAVVGLVVAAVAYWYVDYQGWGDDPPWIMWVWIAATGLAIGVVVLGWPSAPWWRRAVSILAVPLTAISAGIALNVSLAYLPTVQTAWQTATGAQPPDSVDESELAAMVRDGVRPTRGTVVSVKIPDDQSGFAHRRELVYLPPAWFESSPPPRLPAVMMMSGEMGSPGDWINAGDALRILDEFAVKHRGVTPVVVFPDPSGAFQNDTECVNGTRGNSADHLTKDVVPYVISHFGVGAEPSNWGLLGWSTGGTCALTLAVTHPELFSAFVTLDGELGPNTGSKEQTIARLFGGDADAWAAFDPKSVVQAHGRYSGLSAWIGVAGPTPTVYRPSAVSTPAVDAFEDWKITSQDHAENANRLCQFLSGYGIECGVSSYSGSHSFTAAAHGMADALPWLAGHVGAPGAARQPLATALPSG